MKKQFDPNLSSNDSESILFENNETPKEKVEDISFKMTENDEQVEDIIKEAPPSSESHSSTSHHSSGEHHSSSHHHSSSSHHSSGSHHSSSSSGHHHSSSSHHSDGSHHSSSSSGHHHSSSSHHSSKSKKKKMPTWAKVIIAIILVIALLISATFGVFFYLKESGKNDLQTVANPNSDFEEIIEYNGEQYKYNSNVITVAFIGVDKREISLDRDDLNPGCADTDMIAAIDIEKGTVKVLSIPRDTMVDIDVYSSTGVFLKTENVQLTLSYSYGDSDEQSCQNVLSAMSRILYNVPVEKYISLNMEGIQPLNDAVGGVTLEALYDIPSSGIVKGQTVTLKGDMAEAYVRTRDMDHATAAQERGIRQIQYVKAYASQVIPAVRNDFSVLSDLYNTATEYGSTNMSLNNVTYLATLLLNNNVDIANFETYSIDGTTTTKAVNESNSEIVNAQFTPDPDQLMQTVLELFYTKQ